MKKLILLGALALSSVAATAQINAFPSTSNGTTVDAYLLPRTVLSVTITQEREVVIRGPYARYASQYLGVIGAPQTDKESYKILSTTVKAVQEPDPAQTYIIDEKATVPTRVFQWLEIPSVPCDVAPKDDNFAKATIVNQNPFQDLGTTIWNPSEGLEVDRTAAATKSPEQMAADAAATIFKLRKKRIELICAEQGENVFGAGLKSALEEINRLEQEYLALFVGKRMTQVTTKTYGVLPEIGVNRSVVCRFSEAKGVVDLSDVSASPVNVEYVPAKGEPAAASLKKVTTRTLPIRIPQMTQVKVSIGNLILDSQRLPVYQLGGVVQAPVM